VEHIEADVPARSEEFMWEVLGRIDAG